MKLYLLILIIRLPGFVIQIAEFQFDHKSYPNLFAIREFYLANTNYTFLRHIIIIFANKACTFSVILRLVLSLVQWIV